MQVKPARVVKNQWLVVARPTNDGAGAQDYFPFAARWTNGRRSFSSRQFRKRFAGDLVETEAGMSLGQLAADQRRRQHEFGIIATGKLLHQSGKMPVKRVERLAFQNRRV